MVIIFLYLAVFLVFILSLRPRKDDNEILDKNFTNAIKTLFILLIVLSHILNTVHYNDGSILAKGLGIFRGAMGQMCVAPFLFISGYGLFEGYKKHGDAYNKKIFINHFLKIWLFTIICLIPYFIYDPIVNGARPIGDYFLTLIGLKSLGNQSWFIFAILFVYLITFLVGLFKFKNKWINCLIITMLCIGYAVVFKLLGYGSYWYNTIISFPIGIAISLSKDQISKMFVKKRNAIIFLCSSLILYGLCYVLISKTNVPELVFETLQNLLVIVGIISFSRLFTAKKSILLYFGINSWPLFLLHMFPILIFKNVLSNSNLFYVLSFFCSLILTIPFAFLLNRLSKAVFKS